MTRLRNMMLEELERRNYSDRTARGYISAVADSLGTLESRPISSDRMSFEAIKRTC